MARLDPARLHVRFCEGAYPLGLDRPRRYTLTHSDLTGELFLSIGRDYDCKAISGLYTRLMRDEVLAEWLQDGTGWALHVYCHVSGGIVIGHADWRYNIFQYHMPQVLQAFRYGDRALIESISGLDQSPIIVHFRASQPQYCRVEPWGVGADYRL